MRRAAFPGLDDVLECVAGNFDARVPSLLARFVGRLLAVEFAKGGGLRGVIERADRVNASVPAEAAENTGHFAAS